MPTCPFEAAQEAEVCCRERGLWVRPPPLASITFGPGALRFHPGRYRALATPTALSSLLPPQRSPSPSPLSASL